MPPSTLFSDEAANAELFVTTALKPSPALIERAQSFATELTAPLAARRNDGLPVLFARYPAASRTLIVQNDRLMLADREGATIFYHPNMAYLRLGNLLRGGRDLLIEACGLKPGDSVLDTTLGFASEAVLCAHIAGPTGEVHGIEAAKPLGIVVREGLQTLTTAHTAMNEAMRRVQVVHLGHHLEFLRACPDRRYDVVCFDPFFDEVLHDSRPFKPLRLFGDHARLVPEALAEARRVARRRVVVKTVRSSPMLAEMGIATRVESRAGKVVYGLLPAL